jgi:hypothetical protein
MFTFVGAALLLCATWCWWKSLRAIVRGRLSRTWPATDGKIRAARVIKKRNSKGREVWRHEIEYAYAVDGVRHRATRIRFGIPNSLLWSDPSRPSFRELHRGERVEVFHSPSRPSVSALHRGYSPFVFVTIAIGSLLCWWGVGLLRI